jgi:hypothetical protein
MKVTGDREQVTGEKMPSKQEEGELLFPETCNLFPITCFSKVFNYAEYKSQRR